MYPRVGAPLVPDVLMEVLGCERVSSRVVGVLGLPSGMRFEQLDERVWEDLGPEAAADLELSVRVRNAGLRSGHRDALPLRDVSVCAMALIPGFGPQCLLDVLSVTRPRREWFWLRPTAKNRVLNQI
jgi:hypothetical protein